MKDNNMDKIFKYAGERFAKNYSAYRYGADQDLIWHALQFVKHPDLKRTNRLRTKYDFTITKATKESTENILERAITAANNIESKTFYNQYPFSKGEHIDLVRKTENSTEIIELKQWNNDKDSPLYALIEILKYYYLLADPKHTMYKPKTFLTQKEITDLTILAPQEYFDIFPIIGQLKILSTKLAEMLTVKNDKPLNIHFKSFDLQEKDFYTLKYSLKDKAGNSVKDLLKTSNKAKNISWDTPFNMRQLVQYKDKLLWKNWQTLWETQPI